MQKQQPSSSDRLDELEIGQTDNVSRTITAEDVAAFARLSGDYNALHLDDEFAARTEFSSRVVHGFLHASLLSTLVGMRLPGRGALYLSQTIEFSAPVYIGDTVVAQGTIEAISRESRVVDLDTEIRNQNEEVVLRGKARTKVLRLPEPPARRADGGQTSKGQLLSGRTALISGASRGIGRATAALFAAHGAHVWINYCNSHSAADAVCQEIRSSGGTCDVIRADVTHEADVREMMRRISDAGGIDMLVNNAGPKITAKPFEERSWIEMTEVFDQIVGSAFLVTKAALPSLKETGGAIVNVLSSACLQRTSHNWLPYVSAKSALHAMSKNLAQELGPSGITVNMVSPSLVDTDLVAGTPDRMRQMTIGRTPLRRLATVDDVAGAILLLVSPYARFVTGENLLVTGGDIMI